MGLSIGKMRHFSKDDSTLDNKQPKDIEKKIESEIIARRRTNSSNLKENKILIKKNDSEIGNNPNRNENKIHKCLSFDKYQKIEEPIKNLNLITNNKDIIKENDSELNCEKNNKVNISSIEKEDMNNNNINNMDDSQSSEDCTDSKFNSISNKDLLIINENMKSLFLSAAKSLNENESISTSFMSYDKDDNHQILESERLSASISDTNEINDNLDHKSLSLNNSEIVEGNPNKRKFSSPISDSDNFV